jgi:hypothetical protein
MRNKGLIALLVVTVAAVIIAEFAGRGGMATADPLDGTAVLPNVEPRLADIGQLALVRGNEKITLQRQGDAWTDEEKSNYPANVVKVRQTLLGLAELRLVEPKTRKSALYPRLDVEDAGQKGAKSTLVTISDAKGALIGELIVGKHRIDELGGGSDGIYVRKPGDPQSWLARGTLDLGGDPAQWLDEKIVDLPGAQVKQALYTAPDGSKLTIARAKPGDALALAELPAGKKLKNNSTLDGLAGALADLSLTDVQPARAFTFPAAGVSHAQFTSFDGLVLTVDIVDQAGATWLHIAASGDGTAAPHAAELNAKLAPWVYAVAAYKAKTLESKLGDIIETPKPS